MKTVPTSASVPKFIAAIEDTEKRKDARTLCRLMTRTTGCNAVMWGDGIVGFGRYYYRYASGRDGQFFLTGFSPRKQNLTVYIMPGFKLFETLLARLGRHKISKSCLYIKHLSSIEMPVLEDLLTDSVRWMRDNYDCED